MTGLSGEVTERLKVHDWKSCVQLALNRGFESPPLRHEEHLVLSAAGRRIGDPASGRSVVIAQCVQSWMSMADS